MNYETPPWAQQPTETGEAYSAFRYYYYVPERNLDRAWQRYTHPPKTKIAPDDPAYAAPPQWHAWRTEFNWDFRADKADAEQRQLDFEAEETDKGNALSWIAQRQADFRDRLAIYTNLRRGLVKLTESGQLIDRTTKTTVKTEKGWQTTIETVRATEQMKYLERNCPLLFPQDGSVPLTPSGEALFIDLDAASELSPTPPPVRERPRKKYRWTLNTKTLIQEPTEL